MSSGGGGGGGAGAREGSALASQPSPKGPYAKRVSFNFACKKTHFAHILYEPHCPHRARALCVHRRKEDPARPGEEQASHGHPRHLCLDPSCQATVAGPGERACPPGQDQW